MADIISDFPDSVLCYILSFLPTKQVVRTSVLSKRWKFLWRSVPSFDFDLQGGIDDDKEFCSRFFQLIYSFLLFRDKRQLFHRFRLKCFCNHSGERIIEAETIKVALLKSAMRKNGRLEHLDLNLYWRLWVPSPVFRCKTLIVLKLANLTLKDVTFVDLPLLKILHLNYVYFEQCDLPQFLSGTRNLEDMLVNNITANTAEKFHRLPNLVRANIHEHLVPLEVVKDVEVLFTDRIDLKDLVFDLQNLVQLELTLVYRKELVEVLEVLKHCPKLQTLVISTYDDKVYDYHDDECCDEEAVLPYPNSVPSCSSLHLKTCCIGNCRGSLVEIQFGKYILQNAKYLRNMNFWFSGYNCAYCGPLRRHNMIRDLSSCIKSSDTCKLSFEYS